MYKRGKIIGREKILLRSLWNNLKNSRIIATTIIKYYLVTLIEPKLNKQFNEVSQVKACKVTHLFNSLTNPPARRLLKEIS